MTTTSVQKLQMTGHKQTMIYIKFYKPYGVLCTFTDPAGRPNLSDYLYEPDVYTAGRLDMDSEGLLFLTNDGELNHRITSPKYHLPKTYYVLVEGLINSAAIQLLSSGPIIKGNYKTKSCYVEPIPEPILPERGKEITPHGPTAWILMRLNEGKKRQIRHMTAAVGLPTLRLVRVSIGPIQLSDLQPGQWAYLKQDELVQLRNDLKI
jgi:23S rRNA pseudouridine2457 synthase